MQNVLSSYAKIVKRFGERPVLVLALLLFVSIWLCTRLVHFLLLADCGDIFIHLTAEQEAMLMGALIVGVWVALLRRLSFADHILHKMVLDKYREAFRSLDSKAQKTIRQLGDQLVNKGNLYKKMLRLVALVPEPFVELTVVLAIANSLLYIVAHIWIKEPGIIFCNCPWAIATFVSVYLIYNDIRVIEKLKNLIGSITINKFADLLTLVEQFISQLTATERMVMQKRYLRKMRINEIATQMHISNVTVRTHINNINHKWTPYQEEISTKVTLTELLTKFYNLQDLDLV